jgi:hypothetical protein
VAINEYIAAALATAMSQQITRPVAEDQSRAIRARRRCRVRQIRPS